MVVPAAHPLARRKALAYADTFGIEQIEIQPGSMVQLTLRRAAAMAGRTVVHRIQVSTFDAACRNVAAGLGSRRFRAKPADAQARSLGLSVVPLTDAWAKRRFVIVMRARASLTAAARLLADHLHARALTGSAAR